MDYATAAQALGATDFRIMFRHLVPNTMAPLIVQATLQVGQAILVEAALSFLGFGIQPPWPPGATCSPTPKSTSSSPLGLPCRRAS